MQSREEKLLNARQEIISQRINDISQAIQNLIMKLEIGHDTLNWNDMLVDYSHITGQIALLTRALNSERMPKLKNYVVLPVHVEPVEDPHLAQLTEGRMPIFNHETVPNYLRTKLEPEAEERIVQQQEIAKSISPDNLRKQLNLFFRQTTMVQGILKTSRENLESDSALKGPQMQIATANDTYNLIAAITKGKGLKIDPKLLPPQSMPAPKVIAQQPMPNAQANMTRPTSSIKTNIKSMANINPYRR